MQIKNELRKTARRKRMIIPDKKLNDMQIQNNLLGLDEYKTAKTILIYLSLDDEIKTDEIIKNALKSGKKVAVPYCRDKNGNMDFYIIGAVDNLKIGAFGIREPDINKCKRLDNFENSVIIVPALMFDKSGYRLGYGGGYYDRFLSRYSSASIGLCYDELLADEVPSDEFDKSVDIIITQSSVIKGKNGGKNG